jgi:hypothetical protein
MIQTVLQRLIIIYQTDARLVLREQPIFDWVIVATLTLIAAIMFIAQFWVTGILAIGFAGYLILQTKTRLISFDTDPNLMTVILQNLLSQQITNEVSLHSISRAYLFRGEDGGLQIILTLTDGEELGLTNYFKDAALWQEEVVLAINGILHSAHKDDPNRDLMV